MPLRFRRSVSLFPGARLNFSKSGMSVSLGRPGATFNFGSRGSSATLGLPGSGLSYRVQLSQTGRGARSQGSSGGRPDSAPDIYPDYQVDGSVGGEIRSAPVGTLTSASLSDLKRLILEAREQRVLLRAALAKAIKLRDAAYRWHYFRSRWPLCLLAPSRIEGLRTRKEAAQSEVEATADALSSCFIRLSFQMPPAAESAWRDLRAAYEALCGSQYVWDITASYAVDRFRTRSAASETVKRKAISLGKARIEDDVIAVTEPALRLGNVTGVMLDFLPGLCMVQGANSFDLVSVSDIDARFVNQRFIEHERVPHDSKVVDHAWLRSNKDGSRDRRFNGNRQIPIALYGALDFRSRTGINEAYMFSNAEVSARFANAFSSLQSAMARVPAALSEASSQHDSDEVSEAFAVTVPDPVLVPIWFGVLAVIAVLGLLTLGAYRFSPSGRQWLDRISSSIAVSDSGASPPGPVVSGMQPKVPDAPLPQEISAPKGSVPQKAEGQNALPRQIVVVRIYANIRAGSDGGAAIVRVASPGEKLEVFNKANGWLQVGPSGLGNPIGWIAASLTDTSTQ